MPDNLRAHTLPPPAAASDAIPDASGRPARSAAALRVLVGLLLFGAVIAAAARDWHEVRRALDKLSAADLVVSELFALAGLGASVFTWRRILLELGSRLGFPVAAKAYLVGQLGKYLPGSVWAFVFQMELGYRAGAPRSRSLAASLVVVVINLTAALALGLLAVPTVFDGSWLDNAAAILALVLLVAFLTPPVLGRALDLGMRTIRRPPLERRVSWQGVGVASGWSLLTYAFYGLSLWVIAIAAGADPVKALPLCLAGIALAIGAGVLLVVAPSGIGVREAVLVATLAPVLSHGAALGVALVLRAVFTLADLLAALGTVPVRISPNSSQPPSS